MADKKRQFSQASLSDLSMLDSVNENRVMSVLQTRYKDDDIYTNIGPVLIAINPFKQLKHLTTEAKIREYRGKKYFEVPPHPYSLIDDAYNSMITYHENQCVIISGESGSGKTETAKIILNYIAACTGKGTGVQIVKDRMLSSNPILESFGNAKTVNNNNSSRFGKWMTLNFDYGGDPVGGSVQQYLLEKSRVVAPAQDERSFHIFYQITSALNQKQKEAFYLTQGPQYFRYLLMSNCYTVPGIDDHKEWNDTIEAMKVVGLGEAEINEIIRVLAVILWLGNIDFVENQKEESSPTDRSVIDIVAYLLGVSAEVVIAGLTIRTIAAGAKNEIFKKPCRQEEAEFNRDTLAKALYSKVFDYLVNKINLSIMPPDVECNIIGILDIFGFEIFKYNSFEQLCINYVNEKLQQIFIELTIKTEQEEYQSEGIKWTPIPYFDNKPLCDLIEGRPGVLSLLDDTCATNKDERSFVHTMSQMFTGKTDRFQCNDLVFTIQHYAGPVSYDATGFTIKNKDTLFNDLVIILQQSNYGFSQDHGWKLINTNFAQSQRPPTVGKVFNQQVGALMKALMACVPHYVRCIKPNHRKAPSDFDYELISRQVQYLGLLENVRVRCAGFAYRATFERFARRYGVLSEEVVTTFRSQDDRSKVVKLCQYLQWTEGNQYSMGKNKIFIREAAVLFNLEEQLERKVGSAVIVIQSAYRNYLLKRRYLELKAAGWDALKMLNKERRRLSCQGIEYRGDYLNVRTNLHAQNLIQQAGKKEDVLFADRGYFVPVKEKKGFFGSLFGGKDQEKEFRQFMITTEAFYSFYLDYCPPAKQTPEQKQVYNMNGVACRVHFRIPWAELRQLNLSPYSDGFMVVHSSKPDARPQLIHMIRKTECLAALFWVYDQKNSKPPLNRVESDRILVNANKQTYANISWIKDATVADSQYTLGKDKKEKQNWIIACGPAAQNSECPEPYRPAKVDYSSGGRTVVKTTRSAPGNGVDELAFQNGQTLYVVREEENGWLQCEDQQSNLGWVQADAIEYQNKRPQMGGGPAPPGGRPQMGAHNAKAPPQQPPQMGAMRQGMPAPPSMGGMRQGGMPSNAPSNATPAFNRPGMGGGPPQQPQQYGGSPNSNNRPAPPPMGGPPGGPPGRPPVGPPGGPPGGPPPRPY